MQEMGFWRSRPCARVIRRTGPKAASRVVGGRGFWSVLVAVCLYNKVDSGFCGVITALLWPCNQGEPAPESTPRRSSTQKPFVIDGFWVEQWFPSVGSHISSAMAWSTAVTDGGHEDTRHGVVLFAAATEQPTSPCIVHSCAASSSADASTDAKASANCLFARPAPSASLATAHVPWCL